MHQFEAGPSLLGKGRHSLLPHLPEHVAFVREDAKTYGTSRLVEVRHLAFVEYWWSRTWWPQAGRSSLLRTR
jgi:hypothetical protein